MNDFKKIAKTQNMSEQDVEFLVATWIANNTSSQKQSQLPYTAYGLFIDKAYNWVGAAEAFTYTMQYFGIPCITVTT